MNKQQLHGKKLLLRVFLISIILTVITHGAIIILCPRWESFVLFLPGNVFNLLLFGLLFYTGHRVLYWAMVYVFFLRGGLELYLFSQIEGVKIYSSEAQQMVPAFSESASFFLKMVGIPMALSMLGCAMVISLFPSVRDFLAFQRKQTGWKV